MSDFNVPGVVLGLNQDGRPFVFQGTGNIATVYDPDTAIERNAAIIGTLRHMVAASKEVRKLTSFSWSTDFAKPAKAHSIRPAFETQHFIVFDNKGRIYKRCQEDAPEVAAASRFYGFSADKGVDVFEHLRIKLRETTTIQETRASVRCSIRRLVREMVAVERINPVASQFYDNMAREVLGDVIFLWMLLDHSVDTHFVLRWLSHQTLESIVQWMKETKARVVEACDNDPVAERVGGYFDERDAEVLACVLSTTQNHIRILTKDLQYLLSGASIAKVCDGNVFIGFDQDHWKAGPILMTALSDAFASAKTDVRRVVVIPHLESFKCDAMQWLYWTGRNLAWTTLLFAPKIIPELAAESQIMVVLGDEEHGRHAPERLIGSALAEISYEDQRPGFQKLMEMAGWKHRDPSKRSAAVISCRYRLAMEKIPLGWKPGFLNSLISIGKK